MKERNNRGAVIVPSTKLWLDDVEEIIQILEAEGGKATVSDRTHEYDSIQELIERRGTRPGGLNITGPHHNATLSLDRRDSAPIGSWLHHSSSSDAAYLRIRDLLWRRRPLWSRLFWFPLGVIILLGLLWSPALTLLPFEATLPKGLPRAPLVAALALYGVMALLVRSGLFYSVTLVHRHSASPFLRRNKDRIVLLLLGALIVKGLEWAIHRI